MWGSTLHAAVGPPKTRGGTKRAGVRVRGTLTVTIALVERLWGSI